MWLHLVLILVTGQAWAMLCPRALDWPDPPRLQTSGSVLCSEKSWEISPRGWRFEGCSILRQELSFSSSPSQYRALGSSEFTLISQAAHQ